MEAPIVVALIATRDRPRLLWRALVSIARQTRRPDAVIVVEDRSTVGEMTAHVVATAALPPDIETTMIANLRTPGAAGAWNSGLAEAARRYAVPSQVLVAVLDDDDWWDREHVEGCLARAVRDDLELVAADLVRHDDHHPQGRIQAAPVGISAEVALTRNPHIQGSNLFVRLSALLAAGLFDESLRSTTDRDLLVRLADLGVRYAPVGSATVHHDARGNRSRLSTAGSAAKAEGLARFWQKYRLRMTAAQRTAFSTRAQALFEVDLEVAAPVAPATLPPDLSLPCPPLDGAETPSLVLVVAITADGDLRGAARVGRLLDDLLELQDDPRVAALDVVVVENGDGGTALRIAIDQRIERGLRCYLAEVAHQRDDAAAGWFGAGFIRNPGRIGISTARAITQRYARRLMRPGSVAWILDDDKRLVPLVHDGGRLVRRRFDVIGTILQLRSSGADVVLGVDTGAAPLPTATTLRTQLVDLAANLATMHALGPDVGWPDRTAENMALARAAPDYYYDLSRAHTWHLELPCWFVPARGDGTVRAALAALSERGPRLLAGEQVFRPLIVEADAALSLRPSIRRGGNTLVFDAGALVDVPQEVPATAGRPARRSDMVWALCNGRLRGRRVVEATFPVFHDRSDADASALDLATLIDDLRGHALYRMLDDVMARWPALAAPASELTQIARDRYRHYLDARLTAFVLAFHRIRGAARTVGAIAGDPEAWWQRDPSARAHAESLVVFARRVLTLFDDARLDAIRASVAASSLAEVDAYVGSLHARLAAVAATAAATPPANNPTWICAERIRIAQAQVVRLAQPEGPVRLLGAGHEGVVFTDGREVFKYLDLWRANARAADRAFLRSLLGAWSGTAGLARLDRLLDQGPHAILVYRYEPTLPYQGGHATGLVELLRESQAHGIAHRNLHPRNLRVAGERVCLIDYGMDLRPLDDHEWHHMLRRAWLCWRWAHHPDLDALMTRALHQEVAELTGWERLAQAVSAPDARRDLEAFVLAAVRSATPLRALDFGCGAGRLGCDLAAGDVEVVGYDPVASRHWDRARGVTFTTDLATALAAGPYDVVVCTLVICTIADEQIYRAVLTSLRAAVADRGRVVIAVCNPLHTLGDETSLQARQIPPGHTADDTFVWVKRLSRTGVERRDVHRPLERLRRDLLRAGLVVDSVRQTETIDLVRLEPASDFAVIVAGPVVPGPAVSLLIRTSALAWRTLALQVRHLVEQLEVPRQFHERIAVLDNRRDAFTRAYDDADLEAARAALAALVGDGTIDRVVEVPAEPAAVAALHERWFGHAVAATHTATGAPVAASLVGIEACTGELVLHVDDDLLIARTDRRHDHLGELADAFARDPAAVCAALNICQVGDQPWTTGDDGRPWRVEVRATMLHRSRLMASRPWPNPVDGEMLSRSWHRALDARIQRGDLRSLRGGGAATAFVHPPNARKRDRALWLAVLDRMEAGFVPTCQRGHVEWIGDHHDWLGPPRPEPLVVVACGRDVPAGRVARFHASLRAQTAVGWGLVVIEDGGTRTSAEIVRRELAGSARTTVLTLRERRGALANIVWALRHVCRHPEGRVVLVDLDDALLGAGALMLVDAALDRADLVVGGMVRTDKFRRYPVDFDQPRDHRGGNVWQHLRGFRRSLFAKVPDDALRLDGTYVDLAWDWALMLALVELAETPCFLETPLYLHEPSGDGKHGVARTHREEIIARIVGRPSLRSRPRR